MVEAGVEATKHAGRVVDARVDREGEGRADRRREPRVPAHAGEHRDGGAGVHGMKGNYGNALKIASSMPTGGLPALAVVGGGQMGGAGVGTGVLIGPGTGSLGVAGNAMMQGDEEGRGSSEEDAAKDQGDKAAKDKAAAERAAKESALKQAGVKFSRPQLQHAFKHAADFGITGSMNNEPSTRSRQPSRNTLWRQAPARSSESIEVCKVSRILLIQLLGSMSSVMRRVAFFSGWKLSAQQLKYVLTTGTLGGG